MKVVSRRALVIPAAVVAVWFVSFLVLESAAWARAGGGRSMGSRGSRSFSGPSSPSSPSPGSQSFGSGPGMTSPPRTPSAGGPFGRSPFLQGITGGLAAGFLGSLLFGGMGHASGEDPGGGGIGFLDLILLGLLLYFLWRFIKRRRAPAGASGYNGHGGDGSAVGHYGSAGADAAPSAAGPYAVGSQDAIRRGFEQIFRTDPGFDANALRELVQDIFFRVQAGWMHRSLEGILDLLTPEMARDFAEELDGMKRAGRTNRLENIAVRRVEPAEVWQEGGKDYITVLFTANLLDYTTDDATGEVVEGDRLNPVRFEEYWTFCREIGSPRWQLSAIQQAHEPAQRFH